MKKAVIIAAILCLAGFIIGTAGFALAGFDPALLNTSEYVTNEHTVTEDFDNITVLTQVCDVTFALSDDGECRVVTHAPEKTGFAVESENGSLTVREKDTRKWYEFIGIMIGRSSVTVYLPESEYGVLDVESDTGDIDIPCELSFESAKITSDTGDVKVQGITAKNLQIDTDTGDVEVTDSEVEKCISAESDTGDINLKNTKCGNILMDNGTGDVTLTDTIVSTDAHLSTDTGEIILDRFDAKDIFAETSTGDIMGTVLSDKTFFAESDTGKIDVPHCLSTDTFEAKSSTGDIRISIEK